MVGKSGDVGGGGVEMAGLVGCCRWPGGHVLHEGMQLMRMYRGFFPHSPIAAQNGHNSCASNGKPPRQVALRFVVNWARAERRQSENSMSQKIWQDNFNGAAAPAFGGGECREEQCTLLRHLTVFVPSWQCKKNMKKWIRNVPFLAANEDNEDELLKLGEE